VKQATETAKENENLKSENLNFLQKVLDM